MITLHSVPGSRSFRVLWLLYEMGLEPEVITYDIRDGGLRNPEFLAKSPAGRVPALEIDGQVMFESGAITEYLCETRPEHGLAPGVGDKDRAQFLTWLHYAETIGVLVQNLNLQHVFLADPGMRSPTVIGIETKRLAITLKPLERVLEQQDYLLERGFSAADTMMGFAPGIMCGWRSSRIWWPIWSGSRRGRPIRGRWKPKGCNSSMIGISMRCPRVRCPGRGYFGQDEARGVAKWLNGLRYSRWGRATGCRTRRARSRAKRRSRWSIC
jgi:glutathione S-transferase